MTRLRQLVLAYRSRRGKRVPQLDTVSFDSFYNEGPNDQFPITKESSLNDMSPTHSPAREYVKFSAQNYKTTTGCTRPSLATILLGITLVAVFVILPTLYLIHCFGFIPDDNENHHPHIFALKETAHYEPGAKVHDALNNVILGNETVRVVAKELPPPPKPDYSQCPVEDDGKFDCYPDGDVDKDKCEARGCCWMPKKAKKRNKKLNGLSTPYCFYPKNYNSYRYVNITLTNFGLVAFLKRDYRSPYPDDVEVLKMIVKYETEDRLHFKIIDPSFSRFEPPYPDVPVVDGAPNNLSYAFSIINSTYAGFQIIRKADRTVLFDTMNLQTMIFADQFIQISAKLASNKIYGLGEHRNSFLLSTYWTKFTMWNHDGAPQENTNLYGSHPFYMSIEPSGNSHGVFLLNSNAMDIVLQPTPAITYRAIGGVLDFYIVLGPTPANVVQQYTEIIGRPFMPSYWSLGFHLCRFGYKTLNETRKVMQRTIDAGIPLDTQWNDLDYMNNSNDFTYDKENFKDLPSFVKELHSKGMHYIPLIDPGVSASEERGMYPPFDRGLEMEIFVKNSSGQPFVGKNMDKVWNKATTVWPDFTNPTTVDYWTMMLQEMHKLFEFDGAWIDMNEPANFLNGAFNGCPKSSLESPPYVPGVIGGVLNYKTLCMSANHSIGMHYNVHNLYGFTEAMVTNFALATIRAKRPIIISRSTFPGLGKYAGHWSGDVYSEWKDMKYSIPQMLSYSLFGIPLMGADICGFNGNTTVTLCNRWTQLGAFYPFSRNHNTDNGIDQDPVALGSDVIASAKKALSVRYSLLPYLYTLFWAAHVNGDTVARPLFFEYISDTKTYAIDDQFLWGPALMVVPVLQESRLWVNPYLPRGLWYDYYNFKTLASNATRYNMSAPLDTIPVMIRGGYIIPQQDPMQTTTASRQTKLQLLVAPDENMHAIGKLYWDDGDSLNTVEERRYVLINFEMQDNVLTTLIEHWGDNSVSNLGRITIMGLERVNDVKINNSSHTFDYNEEFKFLLIDDLNISLMNPLRIVWK